MPVSDQPTGCGILPEKIRTGRSSIGKSSTASACNAWANFVGFKIPVERDDHFQQTDCVNRKPVLLFPLEDGFSHESLVVARPGAVDHYDQFWLLPLLPSQERLWGLPAGRLRNGTVMRGGTDSAAGPIAAPSSSRTR